MKQMDEMVILPIENGKSAVLMARRKGRPGSDVYNTEISDDLYNMAKAL